MKARVMICACIGVALVGTSYDYEAGNASAQVRGTATSATAIGASVATTMSFVSDPSWESSVMNPDGSEGAMVGPAQFVCLACQPSYCPPGATTLHHISCGWRADLSAIPGAAWVWRAGTRDTTRPANLQGTYFTKHFDIPGLPTEGQIRIAADDFAEVQVNGVPIGSIGSISDGGLASIAQGALHLFDIGPLLLQGLNRVTIRAQNGPQSYTNCDACEFSETQADSVAGRAQDVPGLFGVCTFCNYSGNPAGVVFGGTFSFVAPTATSARSWGSLKARYR